jgi:hypothetical protein
MTSRLYRFGARQYPQHPQHRNIDDHGRAELALRSRFDGISKASQAF